MNTLSKLKKAALAAAMGLALIGQSSLAAAAEDWKFALEEISGSVQEFSLTGLLVAVLGASVLLGIVNLIRRGRLR